MKKEMITFMMLLLLFIFAACTNKGEFKNTNDAKLAFLFHEEINEDNIINEIHLNNGYLLIFEKDVDGTLGYALAYFSKKQNDTLDLIGSTAKIAIDKTGDGRSVGTELLIKDNQTVYFSVGEYKKDTFKRIEGDIKRGIIKVDEDKEIYYTIDID